MLRKNRQGKVGKSSGRQGGPYTKEEMTLYQEVRDKRGRKALVSTHTHTGIGRVMAVERDMKGRIVRTVDEFDIEDFSVKKAVIEAHFTTA